MTPRTIAEFAIGPIGGAILGFITLPIITWYFPQEDVGRFAMLNVVTSFCILFFSLGLDQSYVREFHETHNQPLLFKSTIFPGLLLLLLTITALMYLDDFISRMLFELDSQYLSILVVLVVVFSFIGRFLSLILRMNEKGFAYSLSQILPKFFLLALIISYIVFSADKSLTNLIWGNVVATFFVCLICGWYTRKEWISGLVLRIDFEYLKRLIGFGFPLILGGLAFWGLTTTDKILLKEFSSFKQLGLYSVAVSFAAVASIFQSVFTTIWAPLVYKWAASGKGLEDIKKVNRYVLLIVIVFFCFAGLLSWTVSLVLPETYIQVKWLLISCLGMPLLYTLSETTVVGIGVTRRSSFSMLAAVLAFLINLFGNWWLIPMFGAAGAAASTCVAFFAFLVFRTEFAVYLWKPLPRKLMYSYTILLVAGAVCSTLYGETYRFELFLFWLLALVSVPLNFKSEIYEIKKWLTARFRSAS